MRKESAMAAINTMQLTIPFFSRRKRVRLPLEDRAGMSAPPFGPLDPGIVSDAIPAFFIGRNQSGFWVARDARGQIGGLFVLKTSAIAFAHAQGGPVGCATIFPTEKFELDLDNAGNPLAEQLAPLLRRWTGLLERIGKVVERWTFRSEDVRAR
jgi:hypothetical protein